MNDEPSQSGMLQLIPEPLENGRVAAKWLNANAVVVYAIDWQKQERQNTTLQWPVTIKELRWDADNQSAVLRSLINESQEIFIDLQAATRDSTKIQGAELVDTSRRYRSVMHSCLVQLQKKKERVQSPGEEEEVNAEILLLHYMEMIWSLCEIVIIDTQPGGFCLSQLLTWVQWHFTTPDDIAQRVMTSSDPYDHPDYWQCVYAYLLQGRLIQLKDMLSHHPLREHGTYDAFASIEELLKKMPLFKVSGSHSTAEFEVKWSKWQQECLTRLRGGDFETIPELKVVCEILAGSEEVLQANRHLCDTWYQYLVAKLLFSEPTIKTFDLHSHAVSCIESLNGSSLLTQLDDIVLAAMEFDVHKVIRKCSETFPNWWFVAHLTDLLYHAGQLEGRRSDLGLDMREFLLLEYSASLMSHKSMWAVAAEYLVNCPKFGRSFLEAYVERIPLENDKKANKVICLCERHGLDLQAKSICKVMGMRALKRGKLGAALSWCVRAKDPVFGSIISERFFKHYSETGGFSHLDLLDNLGSTMLLSNHLTFLGKYREFHKMYSDGDFIRAGELLVSLLASKLAPRRFWTILLTDALPLLEDKKIVFDSDQTYELMKCLQDIQSGQRTADGKNGEEKGREGAQAEIEEEQDKVELLRLGLCRNLARSVLEEAS